MPTTALTIGPVHTLTEDVVYALPARSVIILSDTALQVANEITFTSPTVVAADTPTLSAAAFARCTTAEAIVRIVAN